MTKIRRSYTREFKLEALHLADMSSKTKAQVERDLGLSQGLLSHWRQELARPGSEAFPGHGRLSATDEHLRQLERENVKLPLSSACISLLEQVDVSLFVPVHGDD